MSLTGQLERKNFKASSVGRFFQKYEDSDGIRKCLSEMQSTKPVKQPGYKPAERTIWALIGTTIDYLIRYVANGNNLDFTQTISGKTIGLLSGKSSVELNFLFPRISFGGDENIVKMLFGIGTSYLDGRVVDQAAVYSATALALIDNFFRSGGKLPEYFSPLQNQRRDMRDLKRMVGMPEDYDFRQKQKMLMYYDYFCTTLGENYIRDILEIMEVFNQAMSSAEGELFNARFAELNRAFSNSSLVGGADFDCVIEKDGMLTLTDIKTTIDLLPIESLRQIIGYALLHDKTKDKFFLDGVGIYYSRSGSFRHYPIDRLVETCLPTLKNIGNAKMVFLDEIGNDSEKFFS